MDETDPGQIDHHVKVSLSGSEPTVQVQSLQSTSPSLSCCSDTESLSDISDLPVEIIKHHVTVR